MISDGTIIGVDPSYRDCGMSGVVSLSGEGNDFLRRWDAFDFTATLDFPDLAEHIVRVYDIVDARLIVLSREILSINLIELIRKISSKVHVRVVPMKHWSTRLVRVSELRYRMGGTFYNSRLDYQFDLAQGNGGHHQCDSLWALYNAIMGFEAEPQPNRIRRL